MNKLILLSLPFVALAYPPRFGSDPFSPLGPWNKRGPPCGLPKFMEKLPAEAEIKVRDIWSTYKEGEDCDKQHRETRKVVHSLPEEVRDTLFQGKCGPSFLRNVSVVVKKEFRAVWFDHKMNLDEKESTIRKLAYSLLTGESLALFNKWEEELVFRKAELAERLSALTPAAKEAYEQWKQIRLQERTFLGNLPKEIRDELKTLCGFHPKKTTETTQAPTTTTEEPTISEVSTEISTTPAPLVEAETKEKEFRVFLDVQMPEDFKSDAECSIYA